MSLCPAHGGGYTPGGSEATAIPGVVRNTGRGRGCRRPALQPNLRWFPLWAGRTGKGCGPGWVRIPGAEPGGGRRGQAVVWSQACCSQETPRCPPRAPRGLARGLSLCLPGRERRYFLPCDDEAPTHACSGPSTRQRPERGLPSLTAEAPQGHGLAGRGPVCPPGPPPVLERV